MGEICPECGMDLVYDPGNHTDVDCLNRQLDAAQERIERLERVVEAARALKVAEERWYLGHDADYCGAVVDAGRLEELHEVLARLDEADEGAESSG